MDKEKSHRDGHREGYLDKKDKRLAGKMKSHVPMASEAEDSFNKPAVAAYKEITENILKNTKELPKYKSIDEAIEKAEWGVIESFRGDNMIVYIGRVKKEPVAVLLPVYPKNPHGVHEGDCISLDNLHEIYKKLGDTIKIDSPEALREKQIEQDIEERTNKLPDFPNLKQALNSARIGVIKAFKKDGIAVFIGKVQGELCSTLIPWRYENEKDIGTKIEGDFINIENKIPKELFPNRDRMEANRLRKKSLISYINEKGKTITGKIIGYGQSDRRDEVIIQPDKGTQFSIKISTLQKGMERLKTVKERTEDPIDKGAIDTAKEPIIENVKRITYFDGHREKENTVKRDGKSAAAEYYRGIKPKKPQEEKRVQEKKRVQIKKRPQTLNTDPEKPIINLGEDDRKFPYGNVG